jgi:Family of unknown function (DUF5675)
MHLRLERYNPEPDGVFGQLYTPNRLFCTSEDDWRDNEPGVSCIPAGFYTLRRTVYHKHNYETFEITNVPHRSRILIHPGNTEEDTDGCILIGLRFGQIYVAEDEDTHEMHKLKNAVVSSQDAFRRFMRELSLVDTATMEIKWMEIPR